MAAAGSVLSYYGDTIGFQEPYLNTSSSGSSPQVPGYLNVSLGGRGYLAETGFTPFKQDAYRSDSIAPVASKTDISNIPGESSVNSEGLWRREMQDWSLGAGQPFLDRRESKDNRFYTSKGIDPWTKWYASLLKGTTQVYSGASVLQVLVVGAYTYINDNGTIKYATGNLSSWATLSLGASSATTTSAALATDGNNVYVAAGTNGIYLVKVPGSTAAQWITGTVNYVWYAGGQLMAAATNILYNVVTGTATAGPSALPAALYTQANATFVWSTCAAGNSWIYLGGYTSNTSANTGYIYKTQMNTSGTALVVPVTAASLPGGEIPYSLFAYANFMLVGTNLGARFCETLGTYDPGGNAGDLKMGPIVPNAVQQVSKPVRAFTGQFRFVWFGWSNYDATSTGLGRMDLSTFIDAQAPAYTSDLMVTGAGEVMSMDWYNGGNTMAGLVAGTPIFVVAGLGVYTCASTYVSSGTIDGGYITCGLPDKKIALFADFNATGTGTIAGSITVDNATTFTIPTQTLTNQFAEQNIPTSMKGELFDFQATLGTTSSAATPTLRRMMVKFLPAVVSGTQHKIIINLFRSVETEGVDVFYNPYLEYSILDGWRQAASPIQFQEGSQFNVTVVIKSITRLPYENYGLPEGGFAQRMELVLQTLEN